MARSAILRDLSGLPDPLQPWNYDLSIPNVPGGGNGQRLLLACQSASIPGHAIADGVMQLRGAEITYAGHTQWEHDFAPSFIECRDMVARTSLTGWQFYCRDNRRSPTAGSYMANYKTQGDIILYDDAGVTVRTIRLFGLWLQAVQQAPLESSGSGPVVLGANFKYDWWEDL